MRQVFAEGETLTKDLGGTAKTADLADDIIDKLTEKKAQGGIIYIA